MKKNKGIYIEHTSTTREMEMTVCSHMILAYVSHGSGSFYNWNLERRLHEGDIILINNGTPYCFKSDETDRSISMYTCVFNKDELPYTFESLTAPFQNLHSFVNFSSGALIVSDTEHRDLRDIMVKIIDEYSYKQPGYKQSIKCSIITALITLFRLHSVSGNKHAPQNTNQIIGYVYNYANRNIYKKSRLEDIAELMHLTPQYICKVFKETTGMTFIEYCNKQRVEKIKDVLENTDRPIYMIYNDYDFTPRYLNRMFKEHTGFSMSDYKNKFNYKANNPLYPQ